MVRPHSSSAVCVVSSFVCWLLCATGAFAEKAEWIWSDPDDRAPANRFTYFRRVVDLETIPEDAELRFAADSNARLWINGHIVRRKVARYHERHVTAEVVNAGPHLRPGRNVVVVLHHNWGPITQFQRSANEHAGLYVSGAWINTDASWRCITAPQFVAHDKQIPGVIGHYRIRYPQIIDARKRPGGNLHDPGYDDSAWSRCVGVSDGPWPATPDDVETPGQREHAVRPMAVLAAGTLAPNQPISDDPHSVAAGIRTAKCHPVESATREAQNLISGRSVRIEGQAGESHYVTFDFFRPVHGYPFLELADAPEGTVIDFGYCELARALYDGAYDVDVSGWVNPEGVVGPGYADRYITAKGRSRVELPDERTARWLALHVHFRSAGMVRIGDVGIVKSQYPINPVGSFSCGDERIEQIVKLCLMHAEITMSDSYVDTPGREDGQWIEDARPRALVAARWFGDTRLRDLLIRTHAQGQGADGNFHPFAPSNYPAYPACYDWSVQWTACLYDDYVWSGRTDTIRQYWPNLTRYWDHVLGLVDANGIWRTGRIFADIRVGVRTDGKQSSGIVTPWIIERLGWSAEMADATGETEQARKWRAIRDKMVNAFRRHHIVAAKGNVPAHVGDRSDPDNPAAPRGYSQAGQTIAVTHGLLTRDEAFADLDYALPSPFGSPPTGVTRWNNPTYFYRVLSALSHVGLTERGVAHLIERCEPYLPGHPRNPVPLELQGPLGGPLPEYWISREDLGLKPGEVNSAQPKDETGSHSWQAVPLLWLHESLLGVTVTKPGGAELRIAPNAGGLPYVAGHTMTPKGQVYVYWDPQPRKLEVTIPAGVSARLLVPDVCQGKRVRLREAPTPARRTGPNEFLLSAPGTYVLAAE